MSLAGHFWSIAPTVRDLLLPPRSLPAGTTVRVPIADDAFGPGELTATLRVPEHARDLVVLVHGLGGKRTAGYVLRAARELHARGAATLCVDLRGADLSGSGVYHVALTADLHAFLAAPELRRFARVFVLGFSMGGHVALHLAAAPEDPRLCGVAAIGTPLDLHGMQQHLDRPAGAFYRRWVLQGLKRIYAAVAARHAVPTPWAIVRACRTFHAWDGHVICKRYGFGTPEAFYARHAAARVLPQLAVDTVLVHAVADPLVPPELVLPFVGHAARGMLHVCQLPRGGHLQYPRGQSLGLDGADAIADDSADTAAKNRARHGANAASVLAQIAAHWRLGPYLAADGSGLDIAPPDARRQPSIAARSTS